MVLVVSRSINGILLDVKGPAVVQLTSRTELMRLATLSDRFVYAICFVGLSADSAGKLLQQL